MRINGRGDRRYRRDDLNRFVKNAAGGPARPVTRGRRGDAAAAALADANERSRRANLLLAVGAELGRQLDPNIVLNLLVQRTAELFHADRAAVFTRGRGGTYRAAAKLNLSDDYCVALEHATTKPVASIAFEERRVVSLPNIADDPRAHELRHAFLREGINTVTVAPLMSESEPMGALCLYYDQPHEWEVEDVQLLTRIAEQGSTVVRNAENYNRMATWAAQLHSIQQLGTRLTRLRTVDEIGQTICTELNQLIACHNIRVYRVEGEDCVPVAWRGEVGEYEEEDGEQLRLKVGEGITGWVARHGLAQMLGDAAADRRTQTIPGTDENMEESLLLAPMLFEDEVIGVIVLAKLGLNQFGAGRPARARDLRLDRGPGDGQRRCDGAPARAVGSARATAQQPARAAARDRVDPDHARHPDTARGDRRAPAGTRPRRQHLGQRSRRERATELRTIFARGVFAEQFRATELPDDAGVSGDALRTGEAQLVQDQLADPRVLHLGDSARTPGQ